MRIRLFSFTKNTGLNADKRLKSSDASRKTERVPFGIKLAHDSLDVLAKLVLYPLCLLLPQPNPTSSNHVSGRTGSIGNLKLDGRFSILRAERYLALKLGASIDPAFSGNVALQGFGVNIVGLGQPFYCRVFPDAVVPENPLFNRADNGRLSHVVEIPSVKIEVKGRYVMANGDIKPWKDIHRVPYFLAGAAQPNHSSRIVCRVENNNTKTT
jgi:hypothetical protein